MEMYLDTLMESGRNECFQNKVQNKKRVKAAVFNNMKTH